MPVDPIRRWTWRSCAVAAGSLLLSAGCGQTSLETGGEPGDASVVVDSKVPNAFDASDARHPSDATVSDGGACPAGEVLCGAVCTDLQSSLSHCGACDAPCATGEVCSRGACGNTCSGGTTLCGDVCKDLQVDPANC